MCGFQIFRPSLSKNLFFQGPCGGIGGKNDSYNHHQLGWPTGGNWLVNETCPDFLVTRDYELM